MKRDTVFKDHYGFWRVEWCVALFVTVAVLGFAAIGFGIHLSGRHGCDRKATAMGREWRYGWAEGCLVQLSDGTYIQLDKYRLSNAEGE